MAASRYRLFMRLCQEWKLDESKAGRDLGYVIREKVAEGFRQGESSTINETKCTKAYNALQNIHLNIHKEKYPFTRQSGSMNKPLENCSALISNEGLETFK
ncbi:hypothetical protein LOTGIDRAFT_202617 [Lottia gigantea]|uniref:Mitochondrial nucleoid factor 1 n=1 Tax=Lottia gigantea TaxID=225164 RepID=V4BT41_LOTGI|nr:hypothetical protein LOTGIDRAFT_202617 [Lottia gigantea]ESO92284.1 hypothetical protein LOTGIDRAFT_202617 [Lottia gigantea]